MAKESKIGHCKVRDIFGLRLLCAYSRRTTMIVMAVQKDTCFPTLLWLLEITTLLVRVLFEILVFPSDDSALPLLPNPHIQGNCSLINNLPLYIDFLLVCGVTFSTVCLLLYDQLTLLISCDGSVPILSSIWMFLTENAASKFMIIKRSLPQNNIDPFSVQSNKPLWLEFYLKVYHSLLTIVLFRCSPTLKYRGTVLSVNNLVVYAGP